MTVPLSLLKIRNYGKAPNIRPGLIHGEWGFMFGDGGSLCTGQLLCLGILKTMICISR